MNEKEKILFEQFLETTKRRILEEIIFKFAQEQFQAWQSGELRYEEIKPLKKAAEKVGVSTRQYRAYLKGEASPGPKVIDNGLSLMGKLYRIFFIKWDLLDKVKMLYETYSETIKYFGKQEYSAQDIRHWHLGERGDGAMIIPVKPRFSIKERNGEYVLKMNIGYFQFAEREFKATEGDMEKFFDSDICNFEDSWSGFKGKLDKFYKKLPRLENYSDLEDFARGTMLLSAVTPYSHGRKGLEKYRTYSPFEKDIWLYNMYRKMVRSLWRREEDKEIFDGYSDDEIERILEFADQLNLAEKIKELLEMLLKGEEKDDK